MSVLPDLILSPRTRESQHCGETVEPTHPFPPSSHCSEPIISLSAPWLFGPFTAMIFGRFYKLNVMFFS
uniref:Uncharacterized protein n=1 Tax=Scleropages formosus TaxID=113540 RepID=A0A8C9RKW0_SCLFO